MTDAIGIDVHRGVVTAGFGSDPAVALGTACADLLDRPECVYVGYADGAPVASGLGWRSGRTIGVYSIATIEFARRRGYGAAMTARVMADGVDVGCEVAALQASDMGRPIYERLGFRTVVKYARTSSRPFERDRSCSIPPFPTPAAAHALICGLARVTRPDRGIGTFADRRSGLGSPRPGG